MFFVYRIVGLTFLHCNEKLWAVNLYETNLTSKAFDHADAIAHISHRYQVDQ